MVYTRYTQLFYAARGIDNLSSISSTAAALALELHLSTISFEQNGRGVLICPDNGQMMRPPCPGAPAPGAPGPRRPGPQASALVRPGVRHASGGLSPQG
jgi:hypothetical protein